MALVVVALTLYSLMPYSCQMCSIICELVQKLYDLMDSNSMAHRWLQVDSKTFSEQPI